MIGKLDQRVTFQHKTLAADGAGGADETWTAFAVTWGNVRPMTGREMVQAMRADARQNYVITIRRNPEILPSDRVLWAGRFLNIRAVKDAGPRVGYMEIEAELGAPT